MLINLGLGVATMGICLALQIALLTRALLYYTHHHPGTGSMSYLGLMGVLNGVMLLLIVGNLAQVAIWALLFVFLGEFDRYQTAFYHSAVNFATLGYGDIVMSEGRRILGPVQAINGILMVGVTTAAFMTVLRDALKHAARALLTDDAGAVERLVDPRNSSDEV
jgi:hypothetical protein